MSRQERRNEDQAVLRHQNNFVIPPSEKFPLEYPQLWCNFPDENIKSIMGKIEFNNKQLKVHFLSKLNAIIGSFAPILF